MLQKILESLAPKEKKILIGAVIVFSAAAFLRSASALEKNTLLIPRNGGVYREAVIGQPAFINPLISASEEDRLLSALIYEKLGNLAEDIQADKENKIFSVVLKENLKWADGRALGSDDVVFTVETIQDENAHSPLFQSWQGVIVERLSEIQLRFVLRTPYVFFKDNLKNLLVMPAHIFGEIPSANLRLSDYNLEPIGSGPYKFERFRRRKDGFITEYALKANTLSLRKPLIENITFKFYKNDEERLQALMNRQVDGLGGVNTNSIPKISLKYDLHEIPMPRYYAVFMNQNLLPDLKNQNLRLALAKIIDKSGLVARVFGNRAIPVDGPLVPGFPGYDANAYPAIPFDPAAAKDAISSIKKEIAVNFVVPQIDFLVETAEIIKESWNALGVKTNLLILNPKDIVNEVLRGRNYEMILFGNILQYNPDLFSFWHSKERFYPGLNLALYSSPKADDLLEEIRQTENEDLRQAKLSTIQGIISQDIPAIFLYSPRYLYVTKGLKGFEADYIITPSDRFQNVDKWYVKTKRVFK